MCSLLTTEMHSIQNNPQIGSIHTGFGCGSYKNTSDMVLVECFLHIRKGIFSVLIQSADIVVFVRYQTQRHDLLHIEHNILL